MSPPRELKELKEPKDLNTAIADFKAFWAKPFVDIVNALLYEHSLPAIFEFDQRVKCLSEEEFEYAKDKVFSILEELKKTNSLSLEKWFFLSRVDSVNAASHRSNALKAFNKDSADLFQKNILAFVLSVDESLGPRDRLDKFDKLGIGSDVALYSYTQGNSLSYKGDKDKAKDCYRMAFNLGYAPGMRQLQNKSLSESPQQQKIYLSLAVSKGDAGAFSDLCYIQSTSDAEKLLIYQALVDTVVEKKKEPLLHGLTALTALANLQENKAIAATYVERSIVLSPQDNNVLYRINQLSAYYRELKDEAGLGRVASYYANTNRPSLAGQHVVEINKLFLTCRHNSEVIFHLGRRFGVTSIKPHILPHAADISTAFNRLASESPEKFDALVLAWMAERTVKLFEEIISSLDLANQESFRERMDLAMVAEKEGVEELKSKLSTPIAGIVLAYMGAAKGFGLFETKLSKTKEKEEKRPRTPSPKPFIDDVD